MRSINLQTKTLIVALGLIIFLGLLIIIFSKTLLHRKIEIELQKKGVTIAKDIAAESINEILTENFLDLQILLFDHKEIETDIEYIFILDKDGNILSNTFGESFPVNLRKANDIISALTYNIQLLRTERGSIIDVAVPILRGEIGVVRLGLSEKQINGSVNSIIRVQMLIIIGVLILGGIVVTVIDLALTKPIDELMKGVHEISGGNLKYRVNIIREDEIGELAESFNNMTENLSEANRVLNEEIKERMKVENELHNRVEELEDFYNMSVGRELRMKKLKERIEELEYHLTTINDEA